MRDRVAAHSPNSRTRPRSSEFAPASSVEVRRAEQAPAGDRVPRNPALGHRFASLPITAPMPLRTSAVLDIARTATSTPASPLPFKDRIQASFGAHDLDGIKSHQGPIATTSARALGATAFAVGEHAVFARSPSLYEAAHEAAHIVRARSGDGPNSGLNRPGDVHEERAHAAARLVEQGASAESILGSRPTGPVNGAMAPDGCVFRILDEGQQKRLAEIENQLHQYGSEQRKATAQELRVFQASQPSEEDSARIHACLAQLEQQPAPPPQSTPNSSPVNDPETKETKEPPKRFARPSDLYEAKDVSTLSAQDLQDWAEAYSQLDSSNPSGNLARQNLLPTLKKVNERLATDEIKKELAELKKLKWERAHELRLGDNEEYRLAFNLKTHESSGGRDPERIKKAKELTDAFRTSVEKKELDEQKLTFVSAQGHAQEIAKRLEDIVDKPFLLSQSQYPICGANAFLYTTAYETPDVFVGYVLALLQEGRGSIGDLVVKPSDSTKEKVIGSEQKDHRNIHVVDWVAMGSLRSSQNRRLWDKLRHLPEVKGVFSGVRWLHAGISGMTTMGEIESWYQKAGYEIVAKDGGLLGLSPQAFDKAAACMLEPTRCEVVLAVKAQALQFYTAAQRDPFATSQQSPDQNKPEEKDDNAPLPSSAPVAEQKPRESSWLPGSNHVVRLSSKVARINDHYLFRVWTWGSSRELKVPEGRIGEVVYGFVAARRKKEVPDSEPSQ